MARFHPFPNRFWHTLLGLGGLLSTGLTPAWAENKAKEPLVRLRLSGYVQTQANNVELRDPDDTGGFYQPVRLEALGDTAFALERIRCNLPNAPLDVAVELTERYMPNRNARLLPLRAFVNEESSKLDALHGSWCEIAVGGMDFATYATRVE